MARVEKGTNYLELKMLTSESESEIEPIRANLTSWRAITVNSKRIEIELEFSNSLYVSQETLPD